MQVSIVIPVWNGAEVIVDCLESVYQHAGPELLEVICVDNHSQDDSADLIARHFPQTKLLVQPVNLGFAGGVNAGIDAAQGDIFVLLNQDCVVQSGWLTALLQGFEENKHFGIIGCTILNEDGIVNHAGAQMQYPEAEGVHLTEIIQTGPYEVDYVTGAVFAIPRETWDTVGRFDEGFYPAYYEEVDYCYRARAKGLKIGYVPDAQVSHLFSSREWQNDPVKHVANQHSSRFRFVCKHFSQAELAAFFAAEEKQIAQETYLDQITARVIAARDLLRNLSGIVAQCKLDLNHCLSVADQRQRQVGFTALLRQAFNRAKSLEAMQGQTDSDDLAATLKSMNERLHALQQQEHDLLSLIYFRAPASQETESVRKRLFRLLVRRPISFLTGRDYLLQSQLNTVHVARMDLMQRLWQLQQEQVNWQLQVLETLTDYDYR